MCIFLKCFKCINKSNTIEINTEAKKPLDKLNQYSRFKKIGIGATSKIYLTKKGNKMYVCKSISKRNLKKGFREIKILKKIINSNDYFPTLHEFILHDKHLFIFMNYENSVDIHKYCFEPRKNNIPMCDIISMINQMGIAIKTLHSYNFVHLDLKLENFIITDNNTIKLIDFGTVKPLANKEKKLNTIVGTRNYSAPEIYRHRYHTNSDIWSYAICIWILIIKDYCFNHSEINKSFSIETIPYNLFKFPNRKHKILLEKFDNKLKDLFECVFKIFPVDRPDINYIINFDYKKYLIKNK